MYSVSVTNVPRFPEERSTMDLGKSGKEFDAW
jgi:hypothetical protein